MEKFIDYTKDKVREIKGEERERDAVGGERTREGTDGWTSLAACLVET